MIPDLPWAELDTNVHRTSLTSWHVLDNDTLHLPVFDPCIHTSIHPYVCPLYDQPKQNVSCSVNGTKVGHFVFRSTQLTAQQAMILCIGRCLTPASIHPSIHPSTCMSTKRECNVLCKWYRSRTICVQANTVYSSTGQEMSSVWQMPSAAAQVSRWVTAGFAKWQ